MSEWPPHVVLVNEDRWDGAYSPHLRCWHCKARVLVETPVTIDGLVRAAARFAANHRRCRPQPVSELV